VLIPVKALAHAKSRLSPWLAQPEREALVLAMLADTAAAALACDGVGAATVIGSDEAVAAEAAAAGARYSDEEDVLAGISAPGRPGEPARLNAVIASLAEVLRRQQPDTTVAAVHADLPALAPAELAAALAAAWAAPGRCSYVSDRHGAGTSALIAPAGAPLALRFGPDSARAHRRSGAAPVTAEVPGLRCDVDAPADLREALRLGVGPATRAVLARRGYAPPFTA
jgi:2-phospho-L-lactate guanylyltransferase